MDAYPAHWEADVVLRDGGTAHLRPIRPDDAERLVAFYDRVSDQSKYFRFFTPYPRLSERDVHRFTHVDYDDRVALIALIGEEMIGVVRYDRLPPTKEGERSKTAEVAFLVRDDHQGRGLGSVLLEHIAAAARERGIQRFVAEVLPANRRMIAVFEDAGYRQQREFEDGVVHLEFDLEPTETSVAVMRAREHRAEARSIERLLTPRSVAVIGASRSPHTIGQTLLRNLVQAGFTGRLYAVHPQADEILGVPAYRSVRDIPDPVDLAVIAVPAEAVEQVVAECAAKGVHGLVVVSSGFAETGPEGRRRQVRLVELARANGMRVVGPNSFGIANTDPAVALNATLSPIMPNRGRAGFFSQSGALGIAILAETVRRGLGLSTWVSAGNRADVSGNDLLQYWEDDAATDVVLLYLESIGNPRKFMRLARRVSRRKPVVAVKSGRHTQGVPIGHAAQPVSIPDPAVDDLFRQAGIIRVATIDELFDTAQLLAYQPLPRGDRIAIVGNSDSLGLLAKDACVSAGLRPRDPVDLGPTSTADDFRPALAKLLADPEVDAVITVFIPPLTSPNEEVARALAELAADADKPVLTTFLAYEGLPAQLRRLDAGGVPARGSVPSYPAPENAVRALAHAVRYVQWRDRPAGRLPELAGIAEDRARGLVRNLLAAHPGGVELDQERKEELLACYGIKLWPVVPVRDVESAVAAARELGYPVVLKATAEGMRHRSDLGFVQLDLADEDELRRAYATLEQLLGGDVSAARPVVQRMAAPGVATVIGTVEDPAFGPIVSFGVGGVATELLGDRAYRILPLTDVDAAELIRSVKAAPLLFGHRGAEPVDVAALEEVVLRISRLADDLPEVAELELDPVLVARHGCAVLGARIRLSPPPARVLDEGPRALRSPR
ncbi:GNAT family N-acetyltransferase [Carbonactinospora thermoautotrophica]|uniref:bifunctional acetate--CoA ligase family protein/GNAT family N-acetyltransferase n=1 Tax=Carbonactinospora thermoautotrophica TaxID=1469144 RepID=UPI00226D69BE|nr:bifunctional GNAT family N-acetyltransferase/acetate--CoA ligase family protein [Carbonactinospora thermoautotrophica]MCX9191208.1 GNAT family N-acetyltransferase [Carbonactinospora thermoautotrophica]